MSTETTLLETSDWILRQRIPKDNEPNKLLLLLHGWTGDENSMWIFAPRLPEDYLVISPRGMFTTPIGGFSWHNSAVKGWPKAKDFQSAVENLLDLVRSFKSNGMIDKKFDLMGFSQGAALAYAIALEHPELVGRLAGLSGFLPDGLDNRISLMPFQGKKVFIAHGKRDKLVPIAMARQVVRKMKSAGAEVLYCEDDVGHKLSSGCFRGLGEYFVN